MSPEQIDHTQAATAVHEVAVFWEILANSHTYVELASEINSKLLSNQETLPFELTFNIQANVLIST